MSIDHIAVSDTGNGGTNVFLSKPNKKSKIYYEPTVRATAHGGGLGIGEMEMKYTTVDWGGHRYVTGDDVVKVTRVTAERHMGEDRYGNEFHRFMTAACLAKAGLKSGDVDLTVLCPPGFFEKLRPIMMNEFQKNQGEVKIALSGDKSARQWRYANVTVLPEGVAALACFTLDGDGVPYKSDVLNGSVMVIDPGVNTLDTIIVRDGQLNPEMIEDATWENKGLDVFMRRPIVEYLHNLHDDFTITTVDDVDMALRNRNKEGRHVVVSGSQEADITPLIERLSLNYADWISNTVIDSVFNRLRGIRYVIIVGGGAYFITKRLTELYPDKVFKVAGHPTSKGIAPSDMNCVGGARLAMFRLRRQGLI